MKKFKLYIFILIFAFIIYVPSVNAAGCYDDCEKNNNVTTAIEGCKSTCRSNICASVLSSYAGRFSTCNNGGTNYAISACYEKLKDDYNEIYYSQSKSYNSCLTNCQYADKTCISEKCNEDYKTSSYCFSSLSYDASNASNSASQPNNVDSGCYLTCEKNNDPTALAACRDKCNVSICNSVVLQYVPEMNNCNLDTAYAREQCFSSVSKEFSKSYSASSLSYSNCSKKCNDTKNCTCNIDYRTTKGCYNSIYSSYSNDLSSSQSTSRSENSYWSSIGYENNYTDSPCKNENIKNAVKVFGKVISIIQIAVPIILVIMAIIDLTKTILSDSDDRNRKTLTTLIKKFISAILIFFIIAIVRLVCELVGGNSVDTTCLHYISKPW